MVKVTAYITSRNYGRFLEQAIESVVKQVYPLWELILVDEGSNDDTRNIISRFAALDPARIKAVYHKEAVGLQRTANEILAMARGEYLIRLDADDWLDENAFLLMAFRLDAYPEVSLVFSDYYLVDSDGAIIAIDESDPVEGHISLNHRPAHGACTMFRARKLKALGGYSELVNAQDGWDLWFKLMRGSEASRVRLPLFFYRQHNDSMSKDLTRLLEARRKIFDGLASNTGDYKPTVMAVLAVKESYVTKSEVPFAKYGDEVLLDRVLRELERSKSITTVVVISDSQKVLEYVSTIEQDFAKNLLITKRVEKDIDGFVPMDKILSEALEAYEFAFLGDPDIAVFCNLHAVNRKAEHVDSAVNLLKISQLDSVVSTTELRELVFSHKPHGLEVLNPGRFMGITKERERLDRYNGAMVVVWTEIFKSNPLLGRKIGQFEMTVTESKIFTGET